MRWVILFLLAPVLAWADSVPHQGIERYFALYEPPGLEGAAPLVVDLHGYRSEERALAARTRPAEGRWPEMERLAQTEGFRILYPEAWIGRWSLRDGIRGAVLPDGTPIDDIAFIHGLVAGLVAEGKATPGEIFLVGTSDGAILSFRMLCRVDTPFAAAAPLIGMMYERHLKACANPVPPPVMVLAGTQDQILPYDGKLWPGVRGVAIPEILELWRTRHGCDGQESRLLPDLTEADRSRVRVVTWTGCRAPETVMLYRVEGGGHLNPSLTPNTSDWARRAGPQNNDMETADHVWAFFAHFL
ncbi:MAG: hypothetical protein AAF908_04610 [Pseudomonadota bacterium]